MASRNTYVQKLITRHPSSMFVSGIKQSGSSGSTPNLIGDIKENEKRDKLFSGHHRMSAYGMAPFRSLGSGVSSTSANDAAGSSNLSSTALSSTSTSTPSSGSFSSTSALTRFVPSALSDDVILIDSFFFQ